MLCAVLVFASLVLGGLDVPVHVIAFDRPRSLERCLRSINRTYAFCNWTGGLTVLVDGPREASRSSAEVAEGFRWQHGAKLVVWQTRNVGLDAQRNLAESLDSQHWLVVEDDVELSEQACLFVQHGLSLVRAGDGLVGMSLTAAQWQIGVNEHGRWRRLDAMDSSFPPVMSFPAVSTWAQLFERDKWRAWKSYAEHAQLTSIRGSIYEHWFSSSPTTVWSRSYQSFMSMSGSSNLFFNLPDGQALAVSHREPGLNTKRNKGPNGVLLYDALISQDIKDTQLAQYSYCLDDDQRDRPVFLNHAGLGFELQRNHFCFISASRYTNVHVVEDADTVARLEARGAELISGLDYGGDRRLWTASTLKRAGRWYTGAMLECAVMGCPYKAGLYPHHEAAKASSFIC